MCKYANKLRQSANTGCRRKARDRGATLRYINKYECLSDPEDLSPVSRIVSDSLQATIAFKILLRLETTTIVYLRFLCFLPRLHFKEFAAIIVSFVKAYWEGFFFLTLLLDDVSTGWPWSLLNFSNNRNDLALFCSRLSFGISNYRLVKRLKLDFIFLHGVLLPPSDG